MTVPETTVNEHGESTAQVDEIGGAGQLSQWRSKLVSTVLRLAENPKSRGAQVSRLLHRLHVYGLVAKIPRSRRWRVTALGHRVMAAALTLRHRDFPNSYVDAT